MLTVSSDLLPVHSQSRNPAQEIKFRSSQIQKPSRVTPTFTASPCPHPQLLQSLPLPLSPFQILLGCLSTLTSSPPQVAPSISDPVNQQQTQFGSRKPCFVGSSLLWHSSALFCSVRFVFPNPRVLGRNLGLIKKLGVVVPNSKTQHVEGGGRRITNSKSFSATQWSWRPAWVTVYIYS